MSKIHYAVTKIEELARGHTKEGKFILRPKLVENLKEIQKLARQSLQELDHSKDPVFIDEVRKAVANYIGSGSCGFCECGASHVNQQHEMKLAQLLNIELTEFEELPNWERYRSYHK